MVSYNAFNQSWDTHGHIQNTYKHRVPGLDQAYAALIEDLAARGCCRKRWSSRRANLAAHQ